MNKVVALAVSILLFPCPAVFGQDAMRTKRPADRMEYAHAHQRAFICLLSFITAQVFSASNSPFSFRFPSFGVKKCP